MEGEERGEGNKEWQRKSLREEMMDGRERRRRGGGKTKEGSGGKRTDGGKKTQEMGQESKVRAREGKK